MTKVRTSSGIVVHYWSNSKMFATVPRPGSEFRDLPSNSATYNDWPHENMARKASGGTGLTRFPPVFCKPPKGLEPSIYTPSIFTIQVETRRCSDRRRTAGTSAMGKRRSRPQASHVAGSDRAASGCERIQRHDPGTVTACHRH